MWSGFRLLAINCQQVHHKDYTNWLKVKTLTRTETFMKYENKHENISPLQKKDVFAIHWRQLSLWSKDVHEMTDLIFSFYVLLFL